jgi:hypothetical protein
MITRAHFARNYSGCDPTLPPPLCFQVPRANRAPAQGGLIRYGAPKAMLGKPRLMMDPKDPATWQRPYRFT